MDGTQHSPPCNKRVSFYNASMTHIINLSLGVGRVPVDMKLTRVVPLHKKNGKTEVGNYRPVSILNSMSKVIERIVFSQLNEYLVNNKLL